MGYGTFYVICPRACSQYVMPMSLAGGSTWAARGQMTPALNHSCKQRFMFFFINKFSIKYVWRSVKFLLCQEPEELVTASSSDECH